MSSPKPALATAAPHGNATVPENAPRVPMSANALLLSAEQVKNWRPGGPNAIANNVARVPLSSRLTVNSPLFQTQDMNKQFRVMWAPDGMARLAPNIGESSRFNQFNFTHWSYIDTLVWFNFDQTKVLSVPTANWVDAAHKHGVRVLATLMFGGGWDAQQLLSTLERDATGKFIAAEKLARIADYYGFDGYFINQESAGTSEQTARLLRSFMTQLTALLRSKGKHVVFYDSMDANGGGPAYINGLSSANSMYLQEGGQRVATSIFTNYWWYDTSSLRTSRSTAFSLGRDPLRAVYTGIDLWPGRSSGQGATEPEALNRIFAQGIGNPYTSIGMFAANVTYDGANPLGGNRFRADPRDVLNFYRSESVLFEGFNQNAAQASGTWKGLSAYMPPRTSILSLPFETNFNTGHGRIEARQGVVSRKNWHDLSRQDVQPTWQWFRTGADSVRAQYDFDDAYQGGSSVRFSGSIVSERPVTYQLYASRLEIVPGTRLEVTYKRPVSAPAGMSMRLAMSDGTTELFPLAATRAGQWQTQAIDLTGHAGRVIRAIGVTFPATGSDNDYQLNLGRLQITAAAINPADRGRMIHDAELEERVSLRKLPTTGQLSVTVGLPAPDNAGATPSRFEPPDFRPVKVMLLDGSGTVLASGTTFSGNPLQMRVRSIERQIRKVRVEMPDGSISIDFRY